MIFDVFVALIVGGFFILFLIFYLRKLNKSNETITAHLVIEANEVIKEVKSKKNVKDWKRSTKPDSKFVFTHKWLISVLKGQTANILDFDISSSGRHIVSVASDRSIILWKIKDIWQKDRKISRNSINFDHATRVKFSPDDKACIVSLGIENTLRVMKIKKETNNYSFTACSDFPKSISADIISIGIASTGNFIMTCHANTTLALWSLKGELFHTIDTGNMINYSGIVSPCGRFVASTGFAPDARVWSVEFDKSKAFKQVTRAFELKGHNSGVFELCFTHDSTKVASISKDGTWRVWNIDIDFKYQDPVLLKTGKYCHKNNSLNIHISLSSPGHCLCIAQSRELFFIDVETGEVVESMQEVHSDEITAIAYEPKTKIFLSSGGRHINVYNDIVTRQVELRHLKEKLRKSNEEKYQKQRIIDQIRESETTLENLLADKVQN